MAALTFVLRYWRVIAAVLSVVALLGGAGAYLAKVKHDAYEQGYAAAAAKCAQEKAAQQAANQKAIDDAARNAAEIAHQLELKELQVDDILKAIDLAADASPDAGACGLDVGGVRRLSTIN